MKKTYIYKSKKEDVDEIIEILNNKHIEYSTVSDEEIVIGIEDEENINYLIEMLSVTISLNYFMDIVEEYGQSNDWDEYDVDDYIISETNPFPPYYVFITGIILREAIKKSNKINVKAFKKFNLKGFKEEVLSILKLYNDYRNSDMKIDELIKDFYGDENSVEDIVKDVAESFRVLEERVSKDLGEERKDFEVIRIEYVESKGYRLLTKANNEITMDFLKNVLKLGIEVERVNEEAVDEFVEMLALVNFALSIFKPIKIVIDKSINDMEYNTIYDNLIIQMSIIGYRTQIEYKK